MVFTIPNADSTGLGVRFSFATPNDSFILSTGLTFASSDSSAIHSRETYSLAQIQGNVYGGLHAIFMENLQATVILSETAVVAGTGSDAYSDAILLTGSTAVLTNNGQIFGNRMGAIAVSGQNNVITNNGDISGVSGIIIGSGSAINSRVINTGTIIATGRNDNVSNVAYENGVFSVASQTRITNLEGGVIVSSASAGAGVRLNFGDSSNTGSVVVNFGEIISQQYYGVFFNGMLGDTQTLRNYGTIRGLDGAFLGGEEEDIVVNGGLLEGHVLLGAGDDIFRLKEGGRVVGSILGEDGNDTLSGNTGENVFYGGNDDDFLRGRSGDDTLYGGAGNDDLRGGGQNDLLVGGGGDDTLIGHTGDDALVGGAGIDILQGGKGDDLYQFTFATSEEDTLNEQRGGGTDTLEITDQTMEQLDFRRSGDKLIIESSGTAGKVIIDRFYSGNDVYRVEVLSTASSTKFLQTGLNGGEFGDVIVGFSGTQTLYGNDGDDILIGKGDKDKLYGGAGADVFDYDALSDSGTTGTTMDTIYDFVAGIDTIDLFDVDANSILAGDQSFSFIGAGAYTGTAGELRYEFVGGNTQLGADVDGDMVSDFNILIAGNIAFSVGDFIL